MTTKLRIVYASILMLIMLAAIGTASAATVSVVPSSQNAAPGETFSVNVNIDSGSDNLQAAHVELNYDINVLTNVLFTPGSLIGSAILNEPGNGVTPGKITYGAARTSGNLAVPVNGTFFTVQFTVKNSAPAGLSNLDLAGVSLSKDTINKISSPTVNNGQVNIGTPCNSAKVWVVPQTQNAPPGAIFSVNVNIDSGSDNLQAAHVELNYDTSVLTNVLFLPGSLIGSAIQDEPGSGVTPGKITYGAARTSGNPAVPVNGTFFTVQFQVKNSAPAGLSILDLAGVSLKKDAVNNIAGVTVNDGLVNVVKEAKVFVIPQSQDVLSNGVFSVNVNIDSETNNLQSAHVELNFDTSVLNANTLIPGTLLGTDILTEPGSGITPGKITYGAARVSTNPTVPVNGVFFTVQFQVKNNAPAGISNLNLANPNLKSSSTTNIPILIIQNGWVNVISCPCDLNGDCQVNFDDFAIFASAYGTHCGDPNYIAAADLKHDGVINFDDFAMFAAVYGRNCICN